MPENDRLAEVVLDLLVNEANQRPWSERELALELGNASAAADAITNLRAAGLIHRTSDGFVFAARAAIRYSELTQ
jgi:predicted transcriptional regulator